MLLSMLTGAGDRGRIINETSRPKAARHSKSASRKLGPARTGPLPGVATYRLPLPQTTPQVRPHDYGFRYSDLVFVLHHLFPFPGLRPVGRGRKAASWGPITERSPPVVDGGF